MRFKRHIMAPGIMNEASYPGNLGFEELCKYYKVATDKEIRIIEKIIKKNDWSKFKEQIRKVLDISLK